MVLHLNISGGVDADATLSGVSGNIMFVSQVLELHDKLIIGSCCTNFIGVLLNGNDRNKKLDISHIDKISRDEL